MTGAVDLIALEVDLRPNGTGDKSEDQANTAAMNFSKPAASKDTS